MCAEPTKKPMVFVIMPFAEEFTDVYEDLIRDALDGYEVIRADSHLDERNILEKIVRGIDDADLIIADLTTLNANVMYELGVAHALGKPTVMITQTITDLPFDVRSYPAHLYSTYFKRAPELPERLREIAKRHEQGLLDFGNPVTDFRVAPTAKPKIALPPIDLRPATAESSGEAGLTLDEAASEFRDLFGLLASETNLLATHLTQSATEVNRARDSRFGADRIRATYSTTAAHISAYAKAIETQRLRLHDSWRRFGETMLAEVAKARKASGDASAARAAVGALDGSVTTAIDNAILFRTAIASLPATAPDLADACDEAQAAIDGILNELTLGKAYVARIRELLDPDTVT